MALTSTAKQIADVPAHAQGSGLINIVDAWESIQRDAKANEFTVKAPVDTAIDQFLKTPGFGTGVYDREGGLKVGQKKVYDVVVTRTTGVKYGTRHDLTWRNNDGTFKVVGGYDYVTLPLNKPVTIKVEAKATSAGCAQRHPAAGRRDHRGHRQADPDHGRRRHPAGEAVVHDVGHLLGAAQQPQVVLRDRPAGRQDP